MNLLDLIFMVQEGDFVTTAAARDYLEGCGVKKSIIDEILNCWNEDKRLFESVCMFYDKAETRPVMFTIDDKPSKVG